MLHKNNSTKCSINEFHSRHAIVQDHHPTIPLLSAPTQYKNVSDTFFLHFVESTAWQLFSFGRHCPTLPSLTLILNATRSVYCNHKKALVVGTPTNSMSSRHKAEDDDNGGASSIANHPSTYLAAYSLSLPTTTKITVTCTTNRNPAGCSKCYGTLTASVGLIKDWRIYNWLIKYAFALRWTNKPWHKQQFPKYLASSYFPTYIAHCTRFPRHFYLARTLLHILINPSLQAAGADIWARRRLCVPSSSSVVFDYKQKTREVVLLLGVSFPFLKHNSL